MSRVIKPITKEEKKQIKNKFEEIISKCSSCQKSENRKKIEKAFEFAYKAHSDIRRKSGEPYILHPLAVADIVISQIGLGTTSVISALLHDVVEDTDYTVEDIKFHFGETVAYIVEGLTKISEIVEGDDKNIQVENFRKILLTLSKDVRVILIKLADRLHNLRTLEAMPEHKRSKVVAETLKVYVPLAHRLGLYPIKTELEDICFKYRNPEIYEKIRKKIELKKSSVDELFKKFIKLLKPFLDELDIEYEIKYRLKSVASIYRKMKEKGVGFEEIYDVFAIRIVFEPTDMKLEKSQCFTIYSIISDIYRPHPGRLRDWINNPKINGYEALHTTVMGPEGKWVEVQIRSRRMDEIAERGYAAHWKYKEKKSGESEIDKWINKIRETLELQLNSGEDFLDTFEVDIFNLEVYVFTPKGELRVLPYNSTVLDFAYEIHTEIGNHAIGAKVNYKLVPLNYKLQSGDQVEIITSDKQTPEREWLKFVVTVKAKSKIKESFKKERKENIKKGIEIVEKLKKKIGKSFSFRKVLDYYKIKDKDELFCKIGAGLILIEKDIEKILEKKRKYKYIKFWGLKLKKALPGYDVSKTKGKFLVKESSNLDDYVLASCCNPIPGDKVVGFSDANVIEIHKTDCEKLKELGAKYGKKLVEIEWAPFKVLTFLARVRLKGLDRVGILQDITSVISSKRKINMRTVKIDATGGFFDGYLDLYVHNKDDLDNVIEELKQIKGMKTVRREKLAE